MRALIIGASGMLGSALFQTFRAEGVETHGSLRSRAARRYFGSEAQPFLHVGVDIMDTEMLLALFGRVRPDLVINAVGVVKQLDSGKDPLTAIPINSVLPHRLANYCGLFGARLIHISTDCVFNGASGNYTEDSRPDAEDLYGLSKLLGEVVEQPHAVTLRTSIIGHELDGQTGLVEWFLSQSGRVKGFRRAIFSGLPAVELARVILQHVVPNPGLCGLWHVSAAPINKFNLLQLVKRAYGVDTEIEPDDAVAIDRSLDSSRFRAETGYAPSPWPKLIEDMRNMRAR